MKVRRAKTPTDGTRHCAKQNGAVRDVGTHIAGGPQPRIKIDTDRQAVESLLQSVPTLGDSPSEENLTRLGQILREFHIPTTVTSRSLASEATTGSRHQGNAVETVLSDETTKQPNLPSRMARFLFRASGNATTFSKASQQDKSQTHVVNEGVAAPGTASLVLLRDMRVEYVSAPYEETPDDQKMVKESPTENANDSPSNATEMDQPSWFLGCIREDEDTPVRRDGMLNGLMSLVSQSICGVSGDSNAEKKEAANDEHELPTSGSLRLTYQSGSGLSPAPSVAEARLLALPSVSPSKSSLRDKAITMETDQFRKYNLTDRDEPTILPDEAAFAQSHTAVEGPSLPSESLAANSILQGDLLNVSDCEEEPFYPHNPDSRELNGDTALREDLGPNARDQPETASPLAEEIKATPKDRTDVSKIRIVPLFGFMNGVLGHCYFVSLSPEILDINSEGQTGGQSPDERLRGFLEALSKQYPESLNCASPVKDTTDENSIQERNDESNVQSLGLLHRDGDEFIVDPLPGFSLVGGGSRLNSEQLPREKQPHPCCSELGSWDLRALLVAHETKEKLEGMLKQFSASPQSQTDGALRSVSDFETTPQEELNEGGAFKSSNSVKVLEEINRHPSMMTVDSSKFLHGTYSWFAI
jgi:hypothetical protein